MTLTAADFADTGQWRLLLEIGYTGLDAYLENTLHSEIEPQPLCSVKWSLNRDNLRANIEEAVYGNPRLLDDFATRIILYDPRTLFVPTEIAEETAGSEEELYKKVYPAEDKDIMTDSDKDVTAVWEMAPGIKSFLMRTFPGARITCNLMEKVRESRKNNEGITAEAIAREGEVDIILLNGEDLFSASTHEWKHPDDIAYLVFNVLDVYGFKLSDTKVIAKNIRHETQAWDYLREKSREFSDVSY